MSRLKTKEEYEKTIGFKFRRWLYGEEDPYINKVEMVKQHHRHVEEKTITERMHEKQMHREYTYDVNRNKVLKTYSMLYRIASVVFVILIAALLVYNVSWLPKTGAAEKAVNNEVPQRYIENGLQETGAVNIVTGMILDYRAFDTLGESHVLFIATITVLILLRNNKKKATIAQISDRRFEPKNDSILQLGAKILVPVIFVFGIYVVLNGHISPGGGFSGGAIIGAGLILYVSAFGFEKTEKFFTERTYKVISFAALATYCIAKSYSFYTGANHIHSIIPLGQPGAILSSGLILILNICVGMVVACTMYTFYVMFRKGDF
ncbi:MAG: hypothetical protein MJ123_08610 [Lachnospiraceae bacterium]|nr:hypothetical protein [Lachnospiraceae bacterium]